MQYLEVNGRLREIVRITRKKFSYNDKIHIYNREKEQYEFFPRIGANIINNIKDIGVINHPDNGPVIVLFHKVAKNGLLEVFIADDEKGEELGIIEIEYKEYLGIFDFSDIIKDNKENEEVDYEEEEEEVDYEEGEEEVDYEEGED